MRDRYDVVVIGSGFGGSVSACRLAQAGRSVCVLERGRRWTRTDFPRSPSEIADNAFWDPDRYSHGIIEYRVFRRMQVIQGCGVGGGSLHYFNVHIRPPASIFTNPRWPREIDLRLLAPYYELAHDMLDATPLVPPTGRALPTRTQAFQEAAQRIGREAELVDIAVYTGDGRLNPHGGVPQLPCDYSGACGIGCGTQAKNTLDLNYLAIAEHHGAEVHPLHDVHRIEALDGGGYRVSVNRLAASARDRPESSSVDAETVIVSCGTLGSNELLLRCRDQFQTLPRISPALGHGFSPNGDLLLSGGTAGQDIDASRGPSITAGIDFASPLQEAYVEDLGVPEALAWMVEGMLADVDPGRNVLRAVKTLVDGALDIPGATERLARERTQLLAGSRSRRFLPYLGMCEDAADGRFLLQRDGTFDLHWDPAASVANFLELERAMTELTHALDGEYIRSPLWEPLRELLTAHPLGGCAMAEDPEQGVVDQYGAVHGYDNLYVVDGSIVPTALARNPSATISALAERCAFHMLHDRELAHGDTLTPLNRVAPIAAVAV